MAVLRREERARACLQGKAVAVSRQSIGRRAAGLCAACCTLHENPAPLRCKLRGSFLIFII